MKHLLTLLLTLLISVSIQAQNKNIGYITLEGNYNLINENYEENNISGLILTFEQFLYEDGLKTVKIEFKEGNRTLTSEYIVIDVIVADKESKFNIYFMKSVFKEDVILKYNNDEFELWSNHIKCVGKKTEWFSVYVGIFLIDRD